MLLHISESQTCYGEVLAEPNPARTRRKALGLGVLGTQLREFNKKLLAKCLVRALGRIFSRYKLSP
jgi:hypothetical protein